MTQQKTKLKQNSDTTESKPLETFKVQIAIDFKEGVKNIVFYKKADSRQTVAETVHKKVESNNTKVLFQCDRTNDFVTVCSMKLGSITVTEA